MVEPQTRLGLVSTGPTPDINYFTFALFIHSRPRVLSFHHLPSPPRDGHSPVLIASHPPIVPLSSFLRLLVFVLALFLLPSFASLPPCLHALQPNINILGNKPTDTCCASI
ncbi:hypothetical protein V2G26_009579 [Clonostachys chloroleuca]